MLQYQLVSSEPPARALIIIARVSSLGSASIALFSKGPASAGQGVRSQAERRRSRQEAQRLLRWEATTSLLRLVHCAFRNHKGGPEGKYDRVILSFFADEYAL